METTKQFAQWLFEHGYDYNFKNWTFVIKFKSDVDFENVKNIAETMDSENNPQMDIFEEPTDVTESQKLIEADFEEVGENEI